VKFTTLLQTGVAGGTQGEHRLFRTFHNGRCYEIGTSLTTLSTGGFDKEDYESGRVKHFDEADKNKVRSVLRAIADSFRFLK
jgi:hypothetical protein